MRLFRRSSDPPIILPIAAAILGLALWLRDAQAAPVWGITKDGHAFTCQHFTKGPLIEFCFILKERR